MLTYSKWRLENMTDLFCPDSCRQDTECCACENKRSWELEGQVVNLHVKYTDIQGSSIVYIHLDDFNYNYTRLSHVHGRLRKLPTNICSFPLTVELVLDNNEIENLDGINCLSNLDTLYLTHNNLEIIRNSTFQNLKGLRNLYLGKNKIARIEPNSFNLSGGQYILNIDISSNQLESIDVTNFFLKAFCKISYSNNKKSLQIENKLNYKTVPNEKIGCGGIIEFENVSLHTFFNYSDFGLDAWNQIFKNFDLSVSLISDQLTCDCNMAELLSDDTSIAVIGKFWQQLVDFVCERPDELNGTKLIDIYKTNPEKLDLLICNITDSCPRKCHCFNQPSQDRVVVDCQGQNLKTMPENLPWGNGDRLELLLAGNNIQQMEFRPYLSRVAELDLSGNQLSHISEIAASVFPDDAKLNATGNKLSSIPRHFQNRNPTYLLLGHILITCSCDDLWMKTWLSFYHEEESHTSYICQNLGGKDITLADFTLLDCSPDSSELNIILGSLTCFRKWVLRNLAKYLETLGYNLFIPVRDADLAFARDEYLRSRIQTCRSFIVILSEKYFREDRDEVEITQQAFTQFEFNTIWRLYRNDMRRNLIIINFDNLSARDISNRWVKACCRVGEIENFTERQGLLMEIIERKMSPPCGKDNEADIVGLPYRCPYDFNARHVFDGEK
ncbi:Slit-like 3 protein [Mizuhopecten yessoensis]|uniref:Slit-like 3 protein n=1 Tax=Mizuhopecten yessoensis TaxID=6573 RepID=A0A210Q3V4_MIZYE|nr:Slit-like 3 protein [Mizuhopecten yessoensis]